MSRYQSKNPPCPFSRPARGGSSERYQCALDLNHVGGHTDASGSMLGPWDVHDPKDAPEGNVAAGRGNR